MALTDSRLGVGTLTIGTADYGAQITNVQLVPDKSSEDGTPTLADPTPLPLETESWALEGEAIQDFELAAGFVNWCFDNAGTEAPFVFTPTTGKGQSWSGTVLVSSIPIGGDAGVQITAPFSFPVKGKPERAEASTVAP
jgi:hypothetical protein